MTEFDQRMDSHELRRPDGLTVLAEPNAAPERYGAMWYEERAMEIAEAVNYVVNEVTLFAVQVQCWAYNLTDAEAQHVVDVARAICRTPPLTPKRAAELKRRIMQQVQFDAAFDANMDELQRQMLYSFAWFVCSISAVLMTVALVRNERFLLVMGILGALVGYTMVEAYKKKGGK